MAQLIKASHQYDREITDSNPVQVLTFSGFSAQLPYCVHKCNDHTLLDFNFRSSNVKYFIYNYTSID